MEKEEVIKTRVAIEWFFASWYFQLFPQMIKGEVFEDKHFQRLYRELNECINDKIEPRAHGDIIDTYVVIEQKRE